MFVKPNFRSGAPPLQQSSIALPPLQSSKILDQVRERIRYLHYSSRTEESRIYWIRLFIRWSGTWRPHDMGADEVREFLTFLAVKRNASASMHRAALSASTLHDDAAKTTTMIYVHVLKWHGAV